jgi:hypothetical protein
MSGHGDTFEKFKVETVAYQKSLRDVGRIIEKCTIIFLKLSGFRPGARVPFVTAKGPKTMLALSWPFGFPARFADSGGGANSLRSNSAPPYFRNRLHGSATPKAKGMQ